MILGINNSYSVIFDIINLSLFNIIDDKHKMVIPTKVSYNRFQSSLNYILLTSLYLSFYLSSSNLLYPASACPCPPSFSFLNLKNNTNDTPTKKAKYAYIFSYHTPIDISNAPFVYYIFLISNSMYSGWNDITKNIMNCFNCILQRIMLQGKRSGCNRSNGLCRRGNLSILPCDVDFEMIL